MLFPQPWLQGLYDLLQAQAINFIGKVGCDVGDHMMIGVHGHLSMVIKLARLARLYANPSIGIYWTVVCFITRVFAVIVFCPWALGLLFRPFLVARGQLLKLVFACSYLPLIFTCLVVFSLARRTAFGLMIIIVSILLLWSFVHFAHRSHSAQVFFQFLGRHL
jgi:hypothetical protein